MKLFKMANLDSMLKIGMAQISPVWLDKARTIEKVINQLKEAAIEQCELLVFGEGLLPGYPFWLELTNASVFNSKINRQMSEVGTIFAAGTTIANGWAYADYYKSPKTTNPGAIKELRKTARG